MDMYPVIIIGWVPAEAIQNKCGISLQAVFLKIETISLTT
jgi:hypothetical protein